MKNCRKGKAAIWTSGVIRKMRSRLFSSQQRAIFEISLFTGERMGAITQLKVSDVYEKPGVVLSTITFAGNTRKSTKHGQAKTRQMFVHPDLRDFLITYEAPVNGYLFPSDSESGHVTRRGVDKYWREIFMFFGLRGFSTHSSRRWVINSLRANGIEIVTIAELMGMNVQTVRHYLDDDPAECQRAIATLAA